MQKYNLHLDDVSRKKVEKDMKAFGFMNIAPFVRMLIKQYPFKEGKQWSDEDMKDFAGLFFQEIRGALYSRKRGYAARPGIK
jgi:hypothetical protein